MKNLFALLILLFINVSVCLPQNNVGIGTTTEDSSLNPTNKFGHYFSIGLGGGRSSIITDAIGFQWSYSLAYKSHLFSLSHSWALNTIGGGRDDEDQLNFSYYGLLFGEALRYKYFMSSISVGVAYTRIYYYEPITPYKKIIYDRTGLTVPIELKLFILAYNGAGLGLHISKNIEPKYEYSPLMITCSLMFGVWNKPKNSVNQHHKLQPRPK